jgi:hypothetical protein
MSYLTFPLTPEFAVVESADYRTIETRFESGDVQTRARYPKAKRTWRLNWHHASDDDAETMRAFAREHRGNADFFYFTAPEKVAPPYAGPVLNSTPSGSLATRTVYVKYAWRNAAGTGYTTVSNYRSIIVQNNAVVLAKIPYFPTGVTYATIYCSRNNTTYHAQSNVVGQSGGTWQEPDTGWVQTGVVPSTTNTLSESVLVHLSQNSLDITKNYINSYAIVCDFEEVFTV